MLKKWILIEAFGSLGIFKSHTAQAGQRLDIDVYELCARDSNGNEACALPVRRQDGAFNDAATLPLGGLKEGRLPPPQPKFERFSDEPLKKCAKTNNGLCRLKRLFGNSDNLLDEFRNKAWSAPCRD